MVSGAGGSPSETWLALLVRLLGSLQADGERIEVDEGAFGFDDDGVRAFLKVNGELLGRPRLRCGEFERDEKGSGAPSSQREALCACGEHG